MVADKDVTGISLTVAALSIRRPCKHQSHTIWEGSERSTSLYGHEHNALIGHNFYFFKSSFSLSKDIPEGKRGARNRILKAESDWVRFRVSLHEVHKPP